MPEMLDDATSIKTYKLFNPAAESMGELRAWVHDQPPFRVDVTDIPIRVLIEASIEEWDHRGSKAMRGLYFSATEEEIEEKEQREGGEGGRRWREGGGVGRGVESFKQEQKGEMGA